MPSKPSSAERLGEIVVLLRRIPAGKLPESLTAAAGEGNVAGMQLFLDHGSKVEERTVGFVSALAAACSAGQLAAIRFLIANGTKLHPEGAAISPIQAALGKGDCQAAALLLDAGLPIEHAAFGAAAAATLGQVPVLQWLVSRGLDLDATYPRLGVLRAHALQAATKNGRTEVTAYLRGELRPAPVTEPPARLAPPGFAFNALPPPASATERGPLLAEALALIAKGGPSAARWTADLPRGYTDELLISSAAYHGVPEIVTALLDAGADPDFGEPGTPPPLYRAAENGHADLVDLLLARGAKPNGADGKSWLPLLGAVMSGVPSIVQRLIAAGAKPKAKPAGGGNLAMAIRGPYATEIRTLLETAPLKKVPAKSKPAANSGRR